MIRLGQKFGDIADLKFAIEEYEKENFMQLWISHSRTIESAKRRGLRKVIKPELRYAEITYSCINSGKYRSHSKGQRPNQSTFRQGCGSKIVLKASDDGQFLEVIACKEEHNHELLDEETFQCLPRQRALDEAARRLASKLLKLKAKKKLLRNELMKSRNSKVDADDPLPENPINAELIFEDDWLVESIVPKSSPTIFSSTSSPHTGLSLLSKRPALSSDSDDLRKRLIRDGRFKIIQKNIKRSFEDLQSFLNEMIEKDPEIGELTTKSLEKLINDPVENDCVCSHKNASGPTGLKFKVAVEHCQDLSGNEKTGVEESNQELNLTESIMSIKTEQMHKSEQNPMKSE